jgi:hypothetical protein
MRGALDTTICDKVCVFCDSSVVFCGTPVSSNKKTDRHDIAEIFLKVALDTINLSLMQKAERNLFYIYGEIGACDTVYI